MKKNSFRFLTTFFAFALFLFSSGICSAQTEKDEEGVTYKKEFKNKRDCVKLMALDGKTAVVIYVKTAGRWTKKEELTLDATDDARGEIPTRNFCYAKTDMVKVEITSDREDSLIVKFSDN